MNGYCYFDRKVTIYTKSGFGDIVKWEARLREVETGRSYAQYNNAVKVSFTLKKKRKLTGMMLTYAPYMVIVDGWNNPEPEDMFANFSESNGTTVYKSKYACFDDRYCTDFDKIIDKGEGFGDIILDIRHTKGFNAH